ncbi:MAG: orotate phosphoribosyltransferase-like protein [Euryarchaeota archaeon RBG_13_31_8]|nr:MAG: orotate phosphoribosyltransferase-like protein [Euryarchaeota archaeon RBG_13_31_8]
MKEVEALINKAFKYKESGLTEHEIADELNVSKQTAVWLLSKGKEKKPTEDLKVGWRSIGVFPTRISFISDAMCDIILEECKDINTIVGIAVNGIPYATFIADKLGLEMAIYRPHFQKSGAFSSNYASVKEKNVVIVDDVVGSGMTFSSAIKAIKDEKGKPVLCIAVLNKRTHNSIDDVPLRSLIRARVI